MLRGSRVALLAGGDVLALLLFSAIGRFGHGFSVFDFETLRTADPFIAGWFLGAYFVGGYGEDGRGMNGLTKAAIAAAKSWATGIPGTIAFLICLMPHASTESPAISKCSVELGLIVRAASSGHVPPSTFILVTMGSTGVLLIGWRMLLTRVLSNDESKNNDVYRQGSPFELFEAYVLSVGKEAWGSTCSFHHVTATVTTTYLGGLPLFLLILLPFLWQTTLGRIRNLNFPIYTLFFK
ncbi:hypothetical protein NC652_006296 [Populus alba x Populus x berolinensis]|nr:hypothetical protein NC652_006296 [Populus alba x Populus x berolinensis]